MSPVPHLSRRCPRSASRGFAVGLVTAITPAAVWGKSWPSTPSSGRTSVPPKRSTLRCAESLLKGRRQLALERGRRTLLEPFFPACGRARSGLLAASCHAGEHELAQWELAIDFAMQLTAERGPIGAKLHTTSQECLLVTMATDAAGARSSRRCLWSGARSSHPRLWLGALPSRCSDRRPGHRAPHQERSCRTPSLTLG